MTEQRIGVLVMAHGTPAHLDEVEAFYTRIRRGHAPSEAELQELVGRYRAIGGASPLTARTKAQVEALRALLERRAPGRFAVCYGAKHVPPFIEDAARSLLDEDVARCVGLVLTPHRSRAGSEEYLDRAGSVFDGLKPFLRVEQWYDAPGFAAIVASRINDARVQVLKTELPLTSVLFSAHSIPQRLADAGDVYPEQVHQSAHQAVELAGVEDWNVVWQSAGRRGDQWLGPDFPEVLMSIAEAYGAGVPPALIICPVGFVADHLEVLYDIDIEAAAVADKLGITMRRTASLNDDPAFISLLADVVQEISEQPEGRDVVAP